MSRTFPHSAVEVAIQVGLRQAQTVRITRQLPSQDPTAGQAEDRLYDLKSVERSDISSTPAGTWTVR